MSSSFLLGVLRSDWLAYGLGLAAAGLLPVKARPAYRAVFLALALLWGWLALRAWNAHPVWGALAAVEAVLLLTFGTICGWFELRVHHGFWAVVGTSFLVYSLLVLPLLQRYIGGFDYISAFGAPVPLVLLTCGILFFSVEPRAALAFVVPFFWALVAGPEGSRSYAELMGLRVALLASTSLLLLLLSDLRQESDLRPASGASYRIAYRRRAMFGYGLWALILTTVLLFFLPIPPGYGHVTINLALLSLLCIAFWLAFPAWQSLWYRSVAWWTARACGRLWLGLHFAWKWGVLFLAAAALWAFLSNGTSTNEPQRGAGQEASLWRRAGELWGQARAANWPYRLLFMALFLWVGYYAYRGRKRLVIGTFSGCGDEKLDKEVTPALGARLQSELARIADVYKVIDDATPSPRHPVIEVTPGVLDVGEILKDASAITFGTFKLPANFFVGIIGRIVSGPRLIGALHKVADQFVLTAAISGGGLTNNWRVDYGDLSEEEARLPQEAAIQKLIEQLAFRVATDLVSIGSPRWRAVRCYTDGLRLYREAQRPQRNKSAKLREAERCFIRALNDDQRFAQCHYNLGVVYRQLGEIGSAQSAFRRALMQGPDNFDASYALAEALVNHKKYREGLWFCESAIGINPDDARAWDLEAYAYRYHQQDLAGVRVAPPPDHRSWKEIREMSEIAVALAWRALCRRVATGGMPAALEKATAFACARNLAVVLARSSRFPKSRQVFRQAAWLEPHDPDLRLYEGRTLFWDGTLKDSARALEGVFADGMDVEGRGLLWSVLAQVQARSGPIERRRDGVQLAHSRFLDLAAGASAEELTHLIELSLEPPPGRASQEERS
jgi:tetratricopeptide (TPR) repeat protein